MADLIFKQMFIHPVGIREPIAFYSPKYDKANHDNVLMPDCRSTLYWKS